MSKPAIEDLLPRDIEKLPAVPEGMRKFTVYREADESGVSGKGKIIQGVLFANGKCVIQWLVGPDPGDTQIKDWDKFLAVHVESHPGNGTIITFENGDQQVFEPETPEIT